MARKEKAVILSEHRESKDFRTFRKYYAEIGA